jgi:hypothetical protein
MAGVGKFSSGGFNCWWKIERNGYRPLAFSNTGATDEVDFRALPAGERVTSLTEDDGLGLYGAFWTSTLPTFFQQRPF